MDSLRPTRQLVTAGLFLEALKTLEELSTKRDERVPVQILRAELLHRVGKNRDAKRLVEDLLHQRALTPHDRSLCYFILGRIAGDVGDLELAAANLQRSANISTEIGNAEQAAWSQCRLLLVLTDSSGSDAVGPLLAELRKNAARAGSSLVFAGLHLHVSQTEAKQGHLSIAIRHVGVALNMLEATPNVWFQSMAEHILAAIATMRSDFKRGTEHAQRAVELAERSGASHSVASNLANLGNLLFLTGQFEKSIVHYNRALERLSPDSPSYFSALESVARIRLAQGRLSECEDLLERIERAFQTYKCGSRYVYRHALLTKAQLLERKGLLEAAIEGARLAMRLAATADDHLLESQARLTFADLCDKASRTSESLETLRVAEEGGTHRTPDSYALYETVLARSLVRASRPDLARVHFQRSERIYTRLNHVPGLIELERSRTGGSAVLHESIASRESRDGRADIPTASAATGVLHDVAAMFANSDRPELVASEALQILDTVACIRSAFAVLREAGGSQRILARIGDYKHGGSALEHRVVLEGNSDCGIEIVVHPNEDIEAVASVNAIAVLLSAIQNLERARIEREERASLWPVEDLPAENDRAVVTGHMREQMNLAQRVAKTSVIVLITGESGTGKEILARTVHDASERAKKPFVPFNCAAVPRELMESQLFGHRRGAFTGADTNQLGLIRAAHGGTLFLDEIGELALDLQPKLLRFLESGEIAPLGEPSPLTVNVRVVAATNSNLEEAVRNGRFREDLYYRLNVVRLSLRPLRERRDEIPGLVNHFVARAAAEFDKGHLAIAEETLEHLLLFRWPGNIRQLQNELRRMVALAEPNTTLTPDAISEHILSALPLLRPRPMNGAEISVSLHDKLLPTLARVEGEMIKAAFRQHQGRVVDVANALGISRKGLYLKRQRLGL